MDLRRLVIIRILSLLFASLIHTSNGCGMEGVTLWSLPVEVNILDTFAGVVTSRNTWNIEEITGITYGEATIYPPYFDVTLDNSQFVISTNNAFANYEEVEISARIVLTVNFRCTGGGPNTLRFMIDIEDTNNHAPKFMSDEFEFVVAPPLPPGYAVSGCLNDITVRDIDLTTQRIDFTIEDNPYFEIEYDESASADVAKEFKARLITTTFIRSLSEPVELRITATDVDLTNDPPLTAYATLRVVVDSEFQFPEEPIFGQTFYLANYTEDHQLNLFETISLQQGFDEYVNFTLEGEYDDNFSLVTNMNEVTIVVDTPLPRDVWLEKHIFLIVRATREFTSGSSTTIVVQLPEETPLQFERAIYEGTIVNNGIQLVPLVLSQGYEGLTVSAEVIGANSNHSTYFTATVQENLVLLTMAPLADDIIEDNIFISLQVIASSDRSQSSAVVNLKIIKDDNVTPVFNNTVYNGTYDPITGLIADQITFAQGFDESVTVDLIGEYASFFQNDGNGPIITLSSSTIPPELYSEQNILITILASKPRTVGANAAIHITLPAARELEFEESTYRGTIEGNVLMLETILVSYGYEEGVRFNLSGDYAVYFTATNVQEQVAVDLSEPLPESVITENSIIMLTLTASGLNAVPTTTSILLDIIKEDTTTPVFSRDIYNGTYSEAALEIDEIILEQGYEEGVSFRLDGTHAQYFNISNNENMVAITLQHPIPEDVIFSEKVLVFNVLADKALTVGANAAILIRFPTELIEPVVMKFSRNTYVGTLKENEITLENIVLDTGFATGTDFFLSGEHYEHFSLNDTNSGLQISSLNTLPSDVVDNYDLIVLEVEARRQRAVSSWASVVLRIERQEVIAPVFSQAYYTGVYTRDSGLIFEEAINLSEGFDESVTFELTGELSTWFRIIQDNDTLDLVANATVPIDVLENNNQLLFTVVAIKPGAVTGRAVISIDLPKEGSAILGFDHVTYFGTIENNQANISTITLSEGFTQDVVFSLRGDLADHFSVSPQGAVVTLALQSVIPEESIPTNRMIVLQIQATAPQAIPAYATILIEHVADFDVSPIGELIFAQTFYNGTYTAVGGLSFPTPISLTQGYDANVEFDLEGDNSQWFDLSRNDNSVTVTLSSPIPAAVLANNQQLVFVVTAQSPGSATARATVIISLLDEFPEGSAILGFDHVTYLGTIENNQANISTITLTEGFTQDVVVSLRGDLADHFSVSPQGAVVTLALQSVIPEESIPTNRMIVLQIQATAPQAIPAYATILIEHVADFDVSPIGELIFAQTFYNGSYTAVGGLSFPTPISLTQGYDANVEFDLEGDNSQWFDLSRNDNSVTVTLSSPIPAAVLANNQQLVFVVTAQSPGSATARATVIISLLDEFPEGSAILGFDHVTYIGTIENNQANISTITLTEGFTQDVVFSLRGDLADHFTVSPLGAVVTLALQSVIPEETIPTNRMIVLQIQATAPQAIPAYATILIEHVADFDVSPIGELIFAQTFYNGSYTAVGGLSFPTPISLTQGYGANVEFDLEGENSQWFDLSRNDNSVTVTLSSPIPAAVLANNQQLVFVVTAQSPGSATARATVIISLLDEFPEGSAILGFDHVTYLGTIENNQANISTITLTEGFTQNVVFSLRGDLADHFSVSPQGAVVTLALQSVIPEESIPTNRMIVLQIQATAPQAIPAYATILIEHVADFDVSPTGELIFAQTFYNGSYTAVGGLSFPTPISLTQGYGANVEFDLEGDNSQWFDLSRNDNSVTVTLSSPIPAAVLANSQQLVFVVTAQSPGSATARATVIISLLDEFPEGSAILGFDHVTYLGTIENNQANISTITLTEGFTQDVVFSLRGDLADHFTVSPLGAVVTLALQSVIPEESIPINRMIVLQIQATAPQAIPAYATILIEHVADFDVSPIGELIFAQTFYNGSYTAVGGLSFPTPISLTQGYGANVEFDLEGDNSQWFDLSRNDNSVTVTLSSPIPAAVLANNQQLVFVVTALSPGSATARATVIISLLDDFPEGSAILGFDHVTYLGTIENNQANISTITLTEGFTQNVVFSLRGDLADHFSVSPQGAVVTLALQSVIPEESIPTNRMIVIQIQATAPQAIPAYATILIEHVADFDVSPTGELIFAQTFYNGSYTAVGGLSFPTPISLTQGYGANVEFDLEGDNSQWFDLSRNDNSVTVTLSSPIPAAVLANNQQLVFVVTAQSPGSATARATVIISLLDEFPEGSAILGFDHVTYLGTIENNQANISTITLTEGFTQDVVFSLRGDLADHFTVSPLGAVVTLALQSVIPEESIPINRMIVLQIQATAPQAIPAYATILIEHVADFDVSPIGELIFAQTFYNGSYTAVGGLSFPTPISLTQGYGANVEFDLEGDNSQWFDLSRNDNSVTVTLSSPIPAAVLANNQQLVFVVTAQSPGSATGRATVIISLLDEFTEGSAILGFDHVTYLGTIENNQANISTITLTEGFTQDVVFSLRGDRADHFTVSPLGAIVTLALQSVIPEESIPTNRMIVLQIQATAPQAIPAYATILIEHVADFDVSPIGELVFAQTFYNGSYTAVGGLSFPTPISLTQGYGANVEFDLEGDNSQWFDLSRNDNSVTVTLSSPIPAAVLANNQQLVFVVTAQSPGSATARATVIISLLDEFTEGSAILGFDHVTYLGTIENNQANISTITLTEGFTQDVVFSLRGDLADHFTVSPLGAVVTLALQSVIPEESIPINRMIVLQIQATAPQAIPAYATILIEHVADFDVSPIGELIFAQTFYNGSYTAVGGLSFPTPISLTQGYGANVEFDLEGDNSQWFDLSRNDNSVTVTLSSPIPAAVLANNQQLVFVVTAQSPGSATGRAIVIISLLDEFPEGSAILGFDHVTYLGTIENNQVNISTITLTEGFTQDVVFSLRGDLADHFTVSPLGAIVTLALQSVIPEGSIPTNRMIVLQIQATAPQAIPAYATILIEHVADFDVSPIGELIFAQTFYNGSYTAVGGLSFPTPISLIQGYGANVEFDLEGDNSQWFDLSRNDNSVTVTLSSPIPAAVLANNQQLVFVVTAQSPGSATGRATVIISLLDEYPEGSAILGFDHVTYLGTIENNQANISTITLTEGFTQDVVFSLRGDLADHFTVSPLGAIVTLALQSVIPEESIPTNRMIVLQIQATAPQAIPAYATILIEHVADFDVSPIGELIFAQTFYNGSYTAVGGLSFPTPISLTQGYGANVEFDLEGENSQWFDLSRNDNSVTVTLSSPIPAAVLANNQQLVFVVTAQSPGSATARATVIISLLDEFPEGSAILGFDHVTYLGTIENNQVNISTITLTEGFTQDVVFSLRGDLADHFTVSPLGAIVTLALQSVIPEESIPTNRMIVLQIQATAPQAIPAYATILIEHVADFDVSPIGELIFAQTFYNGSYTAVGGLSFPTPISLIQGYGANVEFDLEGDNSQWFDLSRNDNSVTVTLSSPIPAAVLANNQQLVFVVTAQSPGSATARATVIISLLDEFPEGSAILGFDHVTYLGTIENNQVNISTITLTEGFTQDVVFSLRGDLADHFTVSPLGAIVTLALQSVIPEESIPTNRMIVLQIQATAPQAIPAYATILIEHVADFDVSPIGELIFAQTFYNGSYTAVGGLSFPTPISLTQGYGANVEFDLEGDNSQWFDLSRNDNSVTVTLSSPIPAAVLANNQQLVFVVTAQSPGSATARATVIISLLDDSQTGSEAFEKVLFEGIVQNGIVSHEIITVVGFYGSNVELHGEFSSLFDSELSDDVVRITATDPFPLPNDVTHVPLELRAATAAAVLLLNVIHTDVPPAIPIVKFSSPSYTVRVDINQTGHVGQVQASADNGEALIYSLQLDNVHLQERLSVNSEGGLLLSAPANIGSYTFAVVATTIFTQTTGTATIHLSVEAVTGCGDEFVIPPLIVIDVNEEEPHYDLINGTQYSNCHYSLSNRWPLDQTWLYVNETGLHTTPIDREHESIAFMTVSQVQVEIILQCDGDQTRTKRSLTSNSIDRYEYGNNKWIISDTISYDSRRSLVNVIVNDINDNAPIFVGKANEPIVVGYPVPELAERILPRSLAELQATDADIGENAALRYSSSAAELAVAPTTGFVHLRDGATLENNARFRVYAIDRNGEGLAGFIDILVRLLDESYIAVVTVRDAFLDDEETVLSYLSEAVGYEVRVLRSVVISDQVDTNENSRRKRDVRSASGASLQLYVYGLIAQEPVSVDQLAEDISNIVIGPVIVASTVSLQDHLEAQEICVIAGRDVGLLVSTIVLSVLLFIVLVAIAVWYFLRWRKNKNYDKFSDDNSIASTNESTEKFPRPEVLPKPRLDIAELKKSEKRLQEMLDAPIEKISIEPSTSRQNTILDLPLPKTMNAPIVIQSMDKLKDAADESSEDEFGETKSPKRKSVVTFNENVEKIIHVEDTPDIEDPNIEPEYEVYKL